MNKFRNHQLAVGTKQLEFFNLTEHESIKHAGCCEEGTLQGRTHISVTYIQ